MSSSKLGFVLPAGKGSGKSFNVLGQKFFDRITSDDSLGDYYIFDQITPPGMGVPPHSHAYEDEIAFIRSGEFEVFLNGKISKVTTGAILNFTRGSVHGFRNISDQPSETTWVITPGANFQNFIRAVATFSPGPPDFDRLDILHKKHGIEMDVPSPTWW